MSLLLLVVDSLPNSSRRAMSMFSFRIVSMMTLLSMSQLKLSNSNLLHLPLLSQDQILERKRKLLEGSTGKNIAKQQINSLYQGYGTHYVDLWVGTPPQRQTVIVGTGSAKTGFPCSKCYDCGELYHTDAYFDENFSETYRKSSECDCQYGICANTKECVLSTHYEEGSSWFGIESIDVTYAGGPHDKLQELPGSFSDKDKDDADPLRAKNFAFNHTFACMYSTTGLFKTQMADGIIGMDNQPESFWRQPMIKKLLTKKLLHFAFLGNPWLQRKEPRQVRSRWVDTMIGSIHLPWYTQISTNPQILLSS